MRNGPIILIEDDDDDAEIIVEILTLLTDNDIVYIPKSADAIECIRDVFTNPFIILCSANLKDLNGYKLLDSMLMDSVLRLRSTPFIFLATYPTQFHSEATYKKVVQGFFYKRDDHNEFYAILKSIIDYWEQVILP